jgi:16S rRNA (guanine966-N2)-methyltransferase
MRIISGFLKGKKLDFLKSAVTRPLRDFVKESIFNIIKHSDFNKVRLENANILDLYSGVGSFGIECISRGAKNTTFVENDNNALIILKNNLYNLKIEDRSKIFTSKIISFLKILNNKEKFEIIFFDPPFAESFFIKELNTIKESKIYKKKHLIIIHREGKTIDDLKGVISVLLVRKYGRSKVIFGTF